MTTLKRTIGVSPAIAALFLLTLMVSSAPVHADSDGTSMTAGAQVQPTQGHQVQGAVLFQKVSGGIRVYGILSGLNPGKHGFHIHEKGDCSAPDASSAGGHFNPEDTPHGAPHHPADKRHVGDLGNALANNNGVAVYSRVDKVISFEGSRSIIGKAVVVHQGEDDLTSQPSGDAGPRVACGVIHE